MVRQMYNFQNLNTDCAYERKNNVSELKSKKCIIALTAIISFVFLKKIILQAVAPYPKLENVVHTNT